MSSSGTVGSPLHQTSPLEPKKTVALSTELNFVAVKDLSELNEQLQRTAIETYQLAFKEPPYCEYFSEAEVREKYCKLGHDGDLVFGKFGDRVISLTGGYLIGEAKKSYYIDELAVLPEMQQQGVGTRTFQKLLKLVDEKYTEIQRKELCTSENVDENKLAIRIYLKEGFVPEKGAVCVAHIKQDGRIGLDNRVWYSCPAMTDEERLKSLKRAAVVSPSGNVTAVVFDQLLEVDRESLNSKIMKAWKNRDPSQSIEQCCFVTKPKNREAVARVEMFGGEFCGNATRSVVWLLTKGEDYRGLIEVSGVCKPLAFEVKNKEVAVEMPLPAEKEKLVDTVEEGSLVHLEGITHLVVADPNPKQTARELLSNLLAANKYDLKDDPAVGVSYFNPESGKANFSVWVKKVNTIFDETACGSGTCSIGIALALKEKKSIEQDITQPSGRAIRTRTEFADGGVANSWISGKVEVLHNGEYSLQ